MSSSLDIADRIAEISQLLREKTGVSGDTFAKQIKRARHRLPRRVVRQAQLICQAEAALDNPRLRPTVSGGEYQAAFDEVTAHLRTVDLSEQRKSWWLGVLGGMAFNLLAAILLFIAALRILQWI